MPDVKQLYGVPSEVLYCSKCTLSNQRPRLTFDPDGVCSACNYWESKKEIDWDSREAELKTLLDSHRSKDGSPDVIVPCSGGKDSSFVAHVLRERYGMNPLLVTWSPLMPTEIGKKNLESLVGQGFHHVKGTFSAAAAGRLTRLALEKLGYPFLPFVYGQFNFPLQVSVRWGIPLVFYGENGEVEYGGDMTHANLPLRPLENDSRNIFSGFAPDIWAKYGLSPGDVKLLESPSSESLAASKTQVHWFGYYHRWDPQENYYYASQNVGFTPNPERSEGTYSKYASLDDKVDGFHYYLAFVKFGHGRATYDTAQEIRAGKISREEGVALVRKFDGEFPSKHFEEFLDFAGLTSVEFTAFVDSWRSPHLWTQTDNGYTLRKQVS